MMYSSGNSQTQKGMVKVKLIQNDPLVFNGNITGRMYKFRNINDINWVDSRDAAFLKDLKGLEIVY